MNVSIPTSWNQLTGRQLVNVVRTFLSSDKDHLRIRLFWDLVTFRWWKLRDWLMIYRLMQVPDYELAPHADFLLGKDPKLSAWVLTRYRSLFGPNTSMSCVSWQEFTIADTFYLRYRQTREQKYLHLLCATLYRPAGKKAHHKPGHPDYAGDRRREFNSNIPDRHIEKISQWPQHWHEAVLINYEGIRRQIEQEFPYVFSEDNDQQVIQGPKGWDPVTIKLSGDKFGSYRDTQRTPFRTVLKHMEMNAIEIERLNQRTHG